MLKRDAMRPTWADISLERLARNFRAVQDHVGPEVTVCAVVKADAYGHGAVECARALERAGAAWLGVTSTEEGVRLREAAVRARILLMTGFWCGEEDDVVRHKLTPAVWQSESLMLLAAAAEKLGAERVPVHVKVDTGMARLGAAPRDVPALLQRLEAQPRIWLEGLFSHLASAEALDADDAREQAELFLAVKTQVEAAGFVPRLVHMANSATIAARRALHFNFVRPGLALYGYQLPLSSGGDERPSPLNVEPVLSWKTRIIALRDVSAGQGVGYNLTYRCAAASRLAVLPLGYADGLNRHLSSRAEDCARVLVSGEYAPIVGRVSMDLTVIDVTKLPAVAVGDEVVMLGDQGGKRVDAWEHARRAGTVPYEILCGISKRVPRRYD
jgi:alanine racemase